MLSTGNVGHGLQRLTEYDEWRWWVQTIAAYERIQCWWSGVVVSALASVNEVNQRRARLVLRWVTVSGLSSRCGTFISVRDQPPRSTQPGHPFVGRRNEYQPKGRLESKAGMVRAWVAGKTVWSPCYTRAISERFRDKELIYKALYYKFSCLLSKAVFTLWYITCMFAVHAS